MTSSVESIHVPSPDSSTKNSPPQLNSEAEAAGLSVLYVKRKRDEPSNPSLFVQFNGKRQKLFNEFKFVTSTHTEPKKLDREDLYRKYKHENTPSDIKEKVRRDKNTARKNNKYNVISSLRTDNGGLFSAEVENKEEDIMCNTEKMLSQKLTLNEAPPPFISNGSEEWVYDVYLCENSCQGDIDAIHCENIPVDLDFEPTAKERYINEYDEDSNDENYFANDYPDEEEDSEGGWDDGVSDDAVSDDEGVVGRMRYSNEFFDSGVYGAGRKHYLDKYLCSDTDSD